MASTRGRSHPIDLRLALINICFIDCAFYFAVYQVTAHRAPSAGAKEKSDLHARNEGCACQRLCRCHAEQRDCDQGASLTSLISLFVCAVRLCLLLCTYVCCHCSCCPGPCCHVLLRAPTASPTRTICSTATAQVFLAFAPTVRLSALVCHAQRIRFNREHCGFAGSATSSVCSLFP